MRNWWRPREYNDAVGGAESSDHVTAHAVDLDYGSQDSRRRAEHRLREWASEAPWLALSLGLAGVHRPQNGLPTDELRRLLEYRVVGASCHDAAEAEDAAGLGADFVTVSPVFETSSKPGAPLLGLAGLAKIAGPLDVPVYALGGVTPQRVGACLDRGAHGVAVLAGIMAAEDPYRATERYIEALAAHLN